MNCSRNEEGVCGVPLFSISPGDASATLPGRAKRYRSAYEGAELNTGMYLDNKGTHIKPDIVPLFCWRRNLHLS